jgi:hypothetical protein
LAASALALSTPAPVVRAQVGKSTLDDLRAEDVSEGELRVTVVYSYGGESAAQDVSILVSPEREGGVIDARDFVSEAKLAQRASTR